MTSPETWHSFFTGLGPLVLRDTPGGEVSLREQVHPSLRDLVDQLTPSDAPAIGFEFKSSGLVAARPLHCKAVRIRDERGTLRGTLISTKLAVPMSTQAAMAFELNPAHVQRTFSMGKARRRAGAVLFADLESSSALARRLSTSSYFTLVRRLVRAADQCIVDAGGLVGRHVGDGVVAFFPVESYNSESAAALACLSAARNIRKSHRRRRAQRFRDSPPMTSWSGSACIGEPPCSSAASPPRLAPRSPRSATRPTKQHESRRAPPEAARSPRSSCSNASSRPTPPRSASIRTHLAYTQLSDLPTRHRQSTPRRAGDRRLRDLTLSSQPIGPLSDNRRIECWQCQVTPADSGVRVRCSISPVRARVAVPGRPLRVRRQRADPRSRPGAPGEQLISARRALVWIRRR